ncbi:PP2C family protein-serine/threonine phosphatase [Streptomyces griseus]|uniref:PP2C family protein-serine/threonine phosphatase n=1 Tax=Streptomyces griseus TaxID=1911 RepID=UPI00084091F2|nr:PP2C family protein-serine/threonine phosphatase [Streptomyces griseus]
MGDGRGDPAAKRWVRWLPAALIAAGCVVDVSTLGSASAFPLLAAAPGVAAPVLSLRGTIATGMAAILAGLALVVVERSLNLSTDPVLLTTLALLTGIASVLNVRLARDRRQLRTSREVAAAVQRAVLPDPPPRVGQLAVAARYEVAHEEASIGGDLFAVHETPYGIRMLIADVRGKGLRAVRTVNLLLGAFREGSDHMPDLQGVVRQMEGRMQEDIGHLSGEDAESFATAVIAEVAPDYSVLRVANRGHPAPLLVEGGRATQLDPDEPSLPLGLDVFGGEAVRVDRFDLPPGATLVLFTDGVIEARNSRGVFFDPVPTLSQDLPSGPGAALDAVLAAVYRHTGGELQDDAALLAVTRDTSPAAGPAGGTTRC